MYALAAQPRHLFVKRAVDFDQHPLVLGEGFADFECRQFDPVELDVVFGAQLQAEDQFEVGQGRDFGLEALDRRADQVRGR